MCYCGCKYENKNGDCSKRLPPDDGKCQISEIAVEMCEACQYLDDADNCAMWDGSDGDECPGFVQKI